ncbi:hypothetical protein NLI96_g443 [Meripilus lineatus]|uniref:Lysophospholipase n=1 Tax=Meripilus lineatus TaxID=2056292 RepID=A0AAD5VEC7_9APHY|nr:hypothetical protein NLI96_g443 [Physisporinus lineatus]
MKSIADALSTWTWPSTLDYSSVQTQISAFFLELGLGPGSLYSEIVNNPPDPQLYPEVEWDAEVRLGDELCISERAFLKERRRFMRASFARLIGVPERDVDIRDIPIVALAGSGGGRSRSLIGAQSIGLLDCVTYTAGVSGSCWALSVLYSGVAGSHQPRTVADHIKERIKTSYLDIATLDEFVNPPTNKYLLAGILRKAAGSTGTASLVDVYGTLLASRLFVPSDLGKIDHHQLSLHLLRRNVDNGQLPLPIFTAIQPVASFETLHALKTVHEKRAASISSSRDAALSQEQMQIEADVQHLWYEFTPFEVGCDEIGGGEPLLYHDKARTGLDNSLRLYFKEVQPTLKLLPPQLYQWLEDIVTENDRDLGLIHPVVPNQVPNYLKGLQGQLRKGSPVDITEKEYISFMDAGGVKAFMPAPTPRIYGSHGQKVWHHFDFVVPCPPFVSPELAARRGLSTWPKGTGWPIQVQGTQSSRRNASLVPKLGDEYANLELAERQEGELAGQAAKEENTGDHATASEVSEHAPLETCEVWIGTSQSSEVDSSRLDDLDEEALLRRDGIGVVYIPLAPNPRMAPGFDPSVISTWRREVKAEESQALLDTAEVCELSGHMGGVLTLLGRSFQGQSSR